MEGDELVLQGNYDKDMHYLFVKLKIGLYPEYYIKIGTSYGALIMSEVWLSTKLV